MSQVLKCHRCGGIQHMTDAANMECLKTALTRAETKLGQAVEQRDNAMRDAFQKGLKLDEVTKDWERAGMALDSYMSIAVELQSQLQALNKNHLDLMNRYHDKNEALNSATSRLGQAVEQRDNAMRDAFQKGLRLDSALSLLLIHYAKADTVMPNECDELEAAIGFIKGTAVERQA